MSANTGKVDQLKLAGQMADLVVTAVEYVAAGKRDSAATERIMRALQLFKENRLGDVLSFCLTEEGKSPLARTFSSRREAFKAELRQLGEAKAEANFYDGLPTRARNWFQRIPLREIVSSTENYRIKRNCRGSVALADLEKALAVKGLTLDMSDTEIENCFGPHRVRLIVHIEDEKGRELGGRNVVVSTVDGKEEYKAVSFMNGAFFSLAPGRYNIVDPHDQRSLQARGVYLQHESVEISMEISTAVMA